MPNSKIGLELHQPFSVTHRVELVTLLRHCRTQREKMAADLAVLSEMAQGGWNGGRHREAMALLQLDIAAMDGMIARMWVSNNAG